MSQSLNSEQIESYAERVGANAVLSTSPPSSSAGSSGIDWALCGNIVVLALKTWWEWTVACLELWWHVLTACQLNNTSLYRISNGLLLWHYASSVLDTLEPKQSLAAPEHSIESMVSSIPKVGWLLLVPLGMGFTTAVVLVPYLIRIPSPLHHSMVVMALISIFVLEAMIPLMLILCCGLWLFQKASWFSTLCVLGVIWLVVATVAHWIRSVVYQRMGHG